MPRPLAVLGMLLLPALPAAAADKIPWTRDQAPAFAQAGERRGPILILFTSSECGGRQLAGDASRATTGLPSGSGRSGVSSVGEKQDFQDRCELLEQDVLSKSDVVAAVARFVPILSDEGLLLSAKLDPQDHSLNRRYQVATIPTLLFADPWGNEIIRLVGKIPKDGFLQVAKAIPTDFSALEAAGRKLQEDGENAQALVNTAAFYQAKGLPPVSERLFERALGTPTLKADVGARRQVAIARGMNLMQMGKLADAAKLFEATLAEAPDGPAGDALLFGWMMAELQGGRAPQAREVYGQLSHRFPASPYTAKAKQAIEAGKQ